MNIFDIVGPIMIGPSSSHTAGVVRIGQITNKILGCVPNEVVINFYGSFAKTYKGHGSDKAIIGGLLNMNPWDENISRSLEIAKEKNIIFTFIPCSEKMQHPNTLKVIAKNSEGNKTEILGISIGGGNIVIKRINELDVEINGEFNTILIRHIDIPGVVMDVTKILYELNINIANMKVYRSEKGGNAIMIIEVDGKLKEDITNKIRNNKNIINIAIIPSI